MPELIHRSDAGIIIDRDPDDIISVQPDPSLIPTQPQYFTEAKFAEIIGDALQDWFRFVPGIGWRYWNGKYWSRDERGLLQKSALWCIRKLALRATGFPDLDVQAKFTTALSKLENSQKLRSVLGLLEKPLPEVDLTVPEKFFDKNPVELNVQNGILNLETGHLAPHEPERWMSHYVDIPYNASAPLPKTWLEFLERIFGEDYQLIDYVKFLFGFSLTGRMDPPMIPILFGSGANGKSTLLDVLSLLAGTYSARAQAESVMAPRFAKSGSDHSTDIARLIGKRVICCPEIMRDRLHERFLKDWSGGERVTARRLRQEAFEFWPVGKFWLAGNEKPRISGTDDGIWRRVRLIPFRVTIPREERIPRHILMRRLREELPGILAWAVDGFRGYCEEGEPVCETIEQETAEFRQDEDVMGRFLEDSVQFGEGLSAKAGELYGCYTKWCRDNGHHPLCSAKFKSAVTERGLEWARKKAGVYYLGGMLSGGTDEF